MAAVADRGQQERVKPSKSQTRRRRRGRCAQRADRRRSDSIRILATPEAELLKTCGWNLESREMRRREPPTRSTNGKGPRLNRPNGWFIEGDAKTCVAAVDSALWLWFITLDEGDQ